VSVRAIECEPERHSRACDPACWRCMAVVGASPTRPALLIGWTWSAAAGMQGSTVRSAEHDSDRSRVISVRPYIIMPPRPPHVNLPLPAVACHA
jgi:hypothetical protein